MIYSDDGNYDNNLSPQTESFSSPDCRTAPTPVHAGRHTSMLGL